MVDNVSLVLAMVAGSVAAHVLRILIKHWRQVRLSLDHSLSGSRLLLPACLERRDIWSWRPFAAAWRPHPRLGAASCSLNCLGGRTSAIIKLLLLVVVLGYVSTLLAPACRLPALEARWPSAGCSACL